MSDPSYLATMQVQIAEIIEPQRRLKKQKKIGQGSGKHMPKGVCPAGLIPWKPGQSGNPGGRPALYSEVLAMAREFAPKAISRLIELIQSPDDRVALMAADKLLERAYGKPKEIQDDKSSAPPDLGALDAADLAELRRIAGKMRTPNVAQDTTPSAPVEAGVATDGIEVDE